MHLHLFSVDSLPSVCFYFVRFFFYALKILIKRSLKDIGLNERTLISSDMCLISFFKSTSIEMLFEITSLLYANVCVNARI